MPLEVLKSEQKKIFEKLKSFPEFYLVGGTALALQMKHRISVDFDLFSSEDIPLKFLSKVKRIFINFIVKAVINHPGQLSVKINDTKVDFVKYNFPLISNFIHFNGVKLLSIPEIAAMKAYALNRRGVLKDYVDLYFILRGKFSTLKEIKKIAEKKYKDEFNFRMFLEQLAYLEDVKDDEIIFLKQVVSKKEVESFFQRKIGEIKL